MEPVSTTGHGTRINNHPTISPVLGISLGERDSHPGKSQPVFFPFVLVVFHRSSCFSFPLFQFLS
jgi:hypothetical protein